MNEIVLNIEKYSLTFAAAHFLPGFGKCDRLHGHNYRLRVEAKGKLGENHALIDFTLLKKKLLEIIEPLDHKILIASRSDVIEIKDDKMEKNVEIKAGSKNYSFPRKDIIYLPLIATTCEQLSIYIHNEVKKVFPTFKILVEIEETPGSSAKHSDMDF
ncbi:MAG: 6-pyruvoyl tetrahydropterin synthase family protein [Candidatus Odinarchaeota archaeon]